MFLDFSSLFLVIIYDSFIYLFINIYSSHLGQIINIIIIMCLFLQYLILRCYMAYHFFFKKEGLKVIEHLSKIMSFKHFIDDRGGLMFLIGANGIIGWFKQLMRIHG